MNEFKPTRRGFLVSSVALGGAMVVGTSALGATTDVNPDDKPTPSGSTEFTPWLSIAPDGTVTVRATAVDIGNGTLTQIAGYIFEELNPVWDKIKVEYASTNRDYLEKNVYSTPGGALAYFSGRSTGPARMDTYLQVAASARERLKAAAAQAWSVPASEVTVKDGILSHSSGKSAPFGDLVTAAATIQLPQEPKPKDHSEWVFLGKQSPAKVQLPEIVNGSIIYGHDVKVPGMVYAALRQSPVMGGKLKSFDADAVKSMPGVLAVVTVDPGENKPSDLTPPFPFGVSTAQHAVAVIAEHYWQARTALDALPIEWDDGPGAQWKTTEQMNKAALDAVQKTGEKVEFSVGDYEATFKAADAKKVIEQDYLTPYCEQMPMEPLNGTAMVTADRVDFWHPSQHSQMAFYVAADETGVKPENVFFHQPFVGGGFGRRVFSDDARMVVAVAKKYPGKPVHVIWSREEATRQGRYRPLMAAKCRAVIGEDGMPTAFNGRMSGGPGFFVSGMPDTAFTLVTPNAQVESQTVPFHILTGPYRGPGYNSNAFFIETFVDELAHAAGMDPMEYRLKLYGKWSDIGWVKTLQEVKSKSGWGEALPKGQGRGVAVANWGMGGKPDAGTTVATVAKVEVSKQGVLKILQLDVAFDTGRVVNQDAVRTELEGGTMFGLNMAVNEGLNIKDGQIVEGNFDEYPIFRMVDIPPTVNIHFGGLSDNPRYNEIGEPPAGVVGPAVGNAIFAATGKRVRQMPFRTQDLSWA